MKGPIAQGTVRTTFVLGVRLAVQAGTLLLVARMLGPQQFGAFAGIAALAVILGSLSSFGTQTMLLGQVSKAPQLRERVLSFAIPTTTACGATLLVIFLLIGKLALAETRVSIAVLLAIGGAEIVLQPLYGLMRSEHHGLGRIARAQLMQVLPLGLRLLTAGAVLALHLPHPLAAYAVGYFAASIVALGSGAATLPAPWPGWGHWRLPSQPELREALGYAAMAISQAGPAELDKTLATKLLPLSLSGVYAASARVIGAATLPVIAMTLSSLPRLFREGSQPKRTGRLLRWMFGTAAIYSLILAAILWLIAPVFPLIFGATYQHTEQLVRWLCLAVPGIALRLTAGNVLMALSKPWMRVGFELFGLTILVIASALLTARVGTIGMPLALACSEWGMAISGALFVFFLYHARGNDRAN